MLLGRLNTSGADGVGGHDDFSDDVIGNDFDDWVSSWITWRWRNSITL